MSWKGQFKLTEDAKHELVIDSFGAASAVEYFWGPFSEAVGFVLGKVSHPEYSWLKRKKANINRDVQNYCTIALNYEGVPPNTSEYTYRLTGNTSTEPIETHPQFVSTLGGTKAAPITANKPIFDADGKFKAFETGSKYAGVKSYLSAGMIYEETRVMGLLSTNQLNGLGTIDNPPASAALPSPQGRNWLMIGGDVTPIGSGGKVVRRWRLSGKRGWDADIY